MIFKGRQNLKVHKRTPSNQTPDFRSRHFILNYLRRRRLQKSSGALRATLGVTRWMIDRKHATQNRIAFRASCFITGRARGLSQRFSVARTKIKQIAAWAVLFGVRKSSW